ncbi:hypothetical protein AB1Y20_005092 [Prymnesium parvum]|uniref:Uncharacterized protein n=1 Tax=Prymnesium parvum TaxID=97485 RepID=A0AB34J5L1_PRYPA
MECSALAAAQLARLDASQQELLEALRLARLDRQQLAEAEPLLAALPAYTRKLEQLRARIDAVSARTASMRLRSAELAAERLPK